MKVLFLTDGISPYVVGGMQRHTFFVVKWLVKQGVSVMLYHCVEDNTELVTTKDVVDKMNLSSSEERLLKTECFYFPKAGKLVGHYIRRSKKYSRILFNHWSKDQEVYDFVYSKGFCAFEFLRKRKSGLILPKIGTKLHGLNMFQQSPDVKYRMQSFMLRPIANYVIRNSDVSFSYGGKITSDLLKLGVLEEKIIEIPTGIDKAIGEFIVFLDSDDLLSPKCLEGRVEIIENNKQLDFALFPMGSFLKKVGDLTYSWNPVKEKALEKFLSHELPWAICQPIFKTSFLKENKYRYNDKYSRLQDVYFHTIMLLDKPVFETIAGNPDCFYRVDETRKTDTNIEFYRNYANSVILYFQEINMRLESNNMKRQLHKTLLNAIYEINIGRISNKITKEQYHKLSNDVRLTAEKPVFILRLYRGLCSLFSFNIRGLRFLFLKVM